LLLGEREREKVDMGIKRGGEGIWDGGVYSYTVKD